MDIWVTHMLPEENVGIFESSDELCCMHEMDVVWAGKWNKLMEGLIILLSEKVKQIK